MKPVAVIVRASEPARVAEALRAALGLSLRGDRIEVVLADPAQAAVRNAGHAGITRAVATLIQLGHTVMHGDAHIQPVLRRARAVEVWT